MIHIGLAGWGDHDDLYPARTRPSDKLGNYAHHFSIVECDSSFYAIPSVDTVARWTEETPEDFQFVVKAYQGMTGHRRQDRYFTSVAAQFQAFREALEPMIQMDKLGMVLFQYPPWFDCQRKHVEVLRKTREWMRDLPCAIEFRHQSWYRDEMLNRTIDYIRSDGWIHSICDEPQVEEGSIPIVPIATDAAKTLVRFHGRNAAGWTNQGQSDWREVRYLYRYSGEELEEWRTKLLQLEQESQQVYVIFNNNSGGDAAHNAKQLMSMLGQSVAQMAPRQMDLFEQLTAQDR